MCYSPLSLLSLSRVNHTSFRQLVDIRESTTLILLRKFSAISFYSCFRMRPPTQPLVHHSPHNICKEEKVFMLNNKQGKNWHRHCIFYRDVLLCVTSILFRLISGNNQYSNSIHFYRDLHGTKFITNKFKLIFINFREFFS